MSVPKFILSYYCLNQFDIERDMNVFPKKFKNRQNK
jgi:hypothetical protein